MSQQVRCEFLRTLHLGFGDLNYAIIGGAAVVEYDPEQSTPDIDVMVSSRTKEEATRQLLQSDSRFVRLSSGRLA
jgi:hypothetical protein